jgi:hypothetical protein
MKDLVSALAMWTTSSYMPQVFYFQVLFQECPDSHPGTSVGDPIEANVAGRLFAKDKPEDRPVVLGAMKGNIGYACHK